MWYVPHSYKNEGREADKCWVSASPGEPIAVGSEVKLVEENVRVFRRLP